MKNSNYFASCPSHLEPFLEKELISLGATKTTIEKSGVYFEAPLESIFLVIIKSRFSSRVYKEITSFKIKSDHDLYQHSRSQKWDDFFGIDHTYKINTLFDYHATQCFRNSLYMSQKLKDAISDFFRNVCDGERPSIDTKNPDVTLLSRIEKDYDDFKTSIYIDLTGDPLSNRGYRGPGHPAPLRENLAAAIATIANNENKDIDTFYDLTTGSGTLLIELAMIRANIPPSFLKLKMLLNGEDQIYSFLTQHWLPIGSVKQFIKIAKDEVEKAEKMTSKDKYIGVDVKFKYKTLFFNSVNLFPFAKNFEFIIGDALEQRPIKDNGVIISNLPYGERIGEEEELKEFYFQMGELLKNHFKGHKAYFLTEKSNLLKKIRLKSGPKEVFYNGKIECRLLKYSLY